MRSPWVPRPSAHRLAMTPPPDEPRLDSCDLTSLARDLLGHHPDVEDVAQDVWLLLRLQPYGHVRSLGSWLKTTIVHAALRSRQRARRRADRERIVARPDHVPSVADQLERASQQELLSAFVNELREPYREVVRLRYLEEREIDEIAAIVGRSSGTVRSQIKRGLDQMRVRLGLESDRRSWLLTLLPWLRQPTGKRAQSRPGQRVGTRPALVSGIVAGVLVLGVLRVRTESPREELLVSVARVESSSGTVLDAPAPSLDARRAVLLPEVAGRPAELPGTEEGAWDIHVEGSVLDPAGMPVPGAALIVGDETSREIRVAARSDALGHYRIEGVDQRLWIWAERRDWISSDRHFLGSKHPGRDLDLRLGNNIGTLIGRVSSCQGLSVARAEVVLTFRPIGLQIGDQGTIVQTPPPTRVFTADDGSFRLGLPHERLIWLLVLAEGHAPAVSGLSLFENPLQVDITLPSSCILEGLLRRPDGSCAAGAELEILFPRPIPTRQVTTDVAGFFRFEHLPPGPYAVRLLADQTGASHSCLVEGELVEGERVRRDLTLGEAYAIHGRALDGELPLEDWIVELEQVKRGMFVDDLRRTRTSFDGSFTFPSCSLTEEYYLRLLGPGERSAPPVKARAGEQGLVLRASASRSLPGSLAGRFESSVPDRLPTIAVLRSESFSTPCLIRVDPVTGAFQRLVCLRVDISFGHGCPGWASGSLEGS